MTIISDIDKAQLKNSTINREQHSPSTLGFQEKLNIYDNYTLIKTTNYSTVGWVFGLAEHNVTPITTSAQPTTSIYQLLWGDKVVYLGNDNELVTSSKNMNLTYSYKNLQFTSTSNGAEFEHILLKEDLGDKQLVELKIKGTTTPNEKYYIGLNGNASSQFLSKYFRLYDSQKIKIYTKTPLTKLFIKFIRDDDNSSGNETQSIEYIKLNTTTDFNFYDSLKDSDYINYDLSTGTFNNGWEGNTGDELVSHCILYTPDMRIKGFTVDLSETDNNLNLQDGVDEFYISEDGYHWNKVQISNLSKTFTSVNEKGFVYTLPITLVNNYKSFFFKIKLGQDNRYIDTTKGLFKINFDIGD